MRGVRGRTIGVRTALHRPRLWRATAVLSAVLLCGLLLLGAQGSLSIIHARPLAGAQTSSAPSWMRWCSKGEPREDRRRLAFCARVDGLVLATTHGPAVGEAHVALISDFHVVLVL